MYILFSDRWGSKYEQNFTLLISYIDIQYLSNDDYEFVISIICFGRYREVEIENSTLTYCQVDRAHVLANNCLFTYQADTEQHKHLYRIV